MMKPKSGVVRIMPDKWAEMTSDQKRQWRLDQFQNMEGISFVSPEAQNAYQTRIKRIVDVLNVREPDRVPVDMRVGNLPYLLYGISARTAMYDYVQSLEACKLFNEKYAAELEYFASPSMTPGKVMDILDYKLYAWPGHGLQVGAPGIQFMENEYMKVDEYDDLICDPSDFWFRTYLPRVFGAFEPFRAFQTPTSMIEVLSLSQLAPFSNPQTQESLLRLLAVGREYQQMAQVFGSYASLGPASGYPVARGAFAKAPFDTLGDTLRGTAAIMKDIYRRPDKVIAACDKIADLTIRSILKSPTSSGIFLVTYPLHKGADGWMSQKQFETFYWPSLKKVLDALIKEGLIQTLFAEGSFNTRLDYFKVFPKGSICWLFDQTDMGRAKQVLGDKFCIQGNVPSSLIVTGSAGDVKEYCRKLIETCGKGGGYTLTTGCSVENPKPENLRAMVEAAKEYGTYR